MRLSVPNVLELTLKKFQDADLVSKNLLPHHRKSHLEKI